MLIRKESLMVNELCTKDDPRYSINGILVETDGRTIATDGVRLMIYTPATVESGDDYPKVDGCDPAAADPLEPFILGADACKTLLKAIPKQRRPHIPILERIALDTAETNANGHAVLAVTDLENPQVFRPVKMDGRFPNYANVIPAFSDEQPWVGFKVDVVLETLQTMRKQGFKAFRLQLPENPQEKPARIDAKNDAGSAVVVLMSCILK